MLDAGAYARLHSALPQVKIVGEDDYLGAWAVNGGIGMQWREGHDWVAEVDLSPNMNAFKVCQPSVRRTACDITCCHMLLPISGPNVPAVTCARGLYTLHIDAACRLSCLRFPACISMCLM